MSHHQVRPIVLIHGWAGSSASWAPVVRALHDRGAPHVSAVDLPGSPLYRGSTPGRATIAAATSSVIAEIEARHPGQPCLIVGHSMGGQISLLTHARRPDLIAGEVVIDPAYGSTASSDELTRWADEIAAGGHGTLAPFFEEAAGAAMPSADRQRVMDDFKATSIRTIEQYLRSEYLDDDAIGLLEATRPVARQRTRPTLALHTNIARAATERSLSVESQVLVWEGRRHYVHLEAPDEFADTVFDWSARVSSEQGQPESAFAGGTGLA